MTRIRKFWSLPTLEKLGFCEACIFLIVAHLTINRVAFRHINNFLRGRWIEPRGVFFHSEAQDEVRFVKRALSRAASLFPWRSSCLSRSIAAFVMLRRRHIPAVIFLGVKIEDSHF